MSATIKKIIIVFFSFIWIGLLAVTISLFSLYSSNPKLINFSEDITGKTTVYVADSIDYTSFSVPGNPYEPCNNASDTQNGICKTDKLSNFIGYIQNNLATKVENYLSNYGLEYYDNLNFLSSSPPKSSIQNTIFYPSDGKLHYAYTIVFNSGYNKDATLSTLLKNPIIKDVISLISRTITSSTVYNNQIDFNPSKYILYSPSSFGQLKTLFIKLIFAFLVLIIFSVIIISLILGLKNIPSIIFIFIGFLSSCLMINIVFHFQITLFSLFLIFGWGIILLINLIYSNISLRLMFGSIYNFKKDYLTTPKLKDYWDKHKKLTLKRLYLVEGFFILLFLVLMIFGFFVATDFSFSTLILSVTSIFSVSIIFFLLLFFFHYYLYEVVWIPTYKFFHNKIITYKNNSRKFKEETEQEFKTINESFE